MSFLLIYIFKCTYICCVCVYMFVCVYVLVFLRIVNVHIFCEFILYYSFVGLCVACLIGCGGGGCARRVGGGVEGFSV